MSWRYLLCQTKPITSHTHATTHSTISLSASKYVCHPGFSHIPATTAPSPPITRWIMPVFQVMRTSPEPNVLGAGEGGLEEYRHHPQRHPDPGQYYWTQKEQIQTSQKEFLQRKQGEDIVRDLAVDI